MHRRTTRGNRTGLAAVGLALIVTGAGAVLLHLGVLGHRAAAAPIYPQEAAHWIRGHHWVFWLVACLALAIGVLALRWLLVQSRTDRVRQLSMDTESDQGPDDGRTCLLAAAVTTAAARQAETVGGVSRASAQICGRATAPELWLTVRVDEDADIAAISDEMQSSIASDVRQALEMPDLPMYLTLQVSRRRRTRQVA